MENEIKLGTVVEIRLHALGNIPGAKGFCFHEYPIGEYLGKSIIFENGQYAKFNESETDLFLTPIFHSTLKYKFKSIPKLKRDFKHGVFAKVLK